MQLRIELFNQLKNELANLFIDKDSQLAAATNIKMDVTLVAFSNTAAHSWTSIVSRAEIENKVMELVDECIRLKPQNKILPALKASILLNGFVQSDTGIDYLPYEQDKPVTIAVIYDPSNQQDFKDLGNHLAVYRKNKDIEYYDWNTTTDQLACQVILLLITPELMGSDRPYFDIAQEAKSKGVRVVPVLIEKVDWQRIASFKGIAPLPVRGKFIKDNTYWDKASAYTEAGRDLMRLVENIRKKLQV